MNKVKNIDGIEFSVAPFLAIDGARLKAYLAKNFLPALGQIIGAVKNFLSKDGKKISADTQIDGVALAGAIETLMSNLDEDSFISLLKRMLATTVAKGKSGDGKPYARQFNDENFETSFNFVFAGKLFSIYPLLLFILEVNYPDFLSLMGRFSGKLTSLISTSEQESATETGASKNLEMSENLTQA